MKKFIGVLILLFAESWFVSCGIGNVASKTLSVQFDEERCKSQRGNAVSISLTGDNQPRIDEVSFSYSLDDKKWEEPDPPGSDPVRIVGPGGNYRIKAQKEGYFLESALVVVPYDRGCQILEQAVDFTLRPTTCPPDTQLIINVLEPNGPGQLALSTRSPGKEPIRQSCTLQNCIFNLTLTDSGTYEIDFSGFPDNRESSFNPTGSNVQVNYDYEPITIQISDRERKQNIVSEGVDTLTLKIPYNLSPNGCPKVAFDMVTADSTFVFSLDSDLVKIHENATLYVSDSTSPQCLKQPEMISLRFEIELPASTPLGNVRVEYWYDNSWRVASCDINNGTYSCVAEYSNPLHADRYHVRTIISNQEYIAAYVPLQNKCIYFE